MPGVLEGIRVLDFGRYIAGPYCAALLAEQGAEVIRIEKRQGSEDRYQAPVAATGEGALFLQMNRNKLGLTLDPMLPEGQEVVRRLVATADVVVANLPPQTLEAMKLDYASLKAVKPDVILTTVTAYGRGGPYSERVGFDGIGQVMSGAVYMTGTEDQPYRAQVPWVDFGTALHCAFGTMAALMARKVTGKGQWVEGALLATAVTLGNALLIEQAVIAPNRVPTGNRGQTAAPVDIFRTKDGWILAQVIGDP
ncbi:MAG TPA: CoA transferase, partial [Hyphomicrobiaceae bacterium]|nr:CoA transferase [Hyphomicrobiaceae bacterium]